MVARDRGDIVERLEGRWDFVRKISSFFSQSSLASIASGSLVPICLIFGLYQNLSTVSQLWLALEHSGLGSSGSAKIQLSLLINTLCIVPIVK